jgi:hypothetical protein
MNWKTLAALALALVAAVVAALLPSTAMIANMIASGITGAALGALLPQPKTWGAPSGAVEPKAPGQDETPVAVPNSTRLRSIRPRNRGLSNLGLLLAAVVLGVLLLGLVRYAKADSQFGGCFAGGKVCAGPSATVTVGEFNLSTSKFSGGVSPGLGYGLTYMPDAWYATGVAGYLAFSVGGEQPNHARPSLMFSFANYLRIGAGMAITEQPIGTLKQWSLLFGIGSDFGGSPKYLRAVATQEKP